MSNLRKAYAVFAPLLSAALAAHEYPENDPVPTAEENQTVLTNLGNLVEMLAPAPAPAPAPEPTPEQVAAEALKNEAVTAFASAMQTAAENADSAGLDEQTMQNMVVQGFGIDETDLADPAEKLVDDVSPATREAAASEETKVTGRMKVSA